MIAAIVIVAQYEGTLDLLDSSKIDLRSTVTCNGPCSLPTIDNGTKEIALATDLATNPAARLGIHTRHTDITAGYSLAITAPDAELGFRWPHGLPETNDMQLFQTGFAAVGWRGRFTTLSLSETGSFGELNSALLYLLPTPAGQMATTPQTELSPVTIKYGSSDTNGSVAVTATRRLNVAVSAGYTLSGPIDGSVPGVVADQRTERAGATLNDLVSGRTRLSTIADGLATRTSGPCPPLPGQPPIPVPVSATPTVVTCNDTTTIYDLREMLYEQLSRTLSLDVGAGAGLSIIDAPEIGGPGIHDAVIYPEVIATVTDRFGHLGADGLQLSATLTPVVDNRTGLPSERAQLLGTLAENLAPRVMGSLTTGLVQSIPAFTSSPADDPYPLTLVNVGVDAKIRVDRQVDLDVGEQTFWQTQKGYGSFFSAIGYVSVTARAPTLDF